MQREFDAQEANINALEGVDILTLAKKIEAVAAKVEALPLIRSVCFSQHFPSQHLRPLFFTSAGWESAG